jgi:hypothetical protein
MVRVPRLDAPIRPVVYAFAAPAVLLSQNAAVASIYAAERQPLLPDATFWLLPLRALARLDNLPLWLESGAFVFSLAVASVLVLLSFRRASYSRRGYGVAALTIMPIVQIAAVLALALMPIAEREEPPPAEVGSTAVAVAKGVLGGIALIVFAVVVSAQFMGVYGWGLFVLTPFLVGVTTAYFANRSRPFGDVQTLRLVLAAAALGCLSLIMFALEGLICIILASPLGAGAAILGGLLGKRMAVLRAGRATPVMSFAVLPFVFMLEAAMPPATLLQSREVIDIAAAPADVWHVLTRPSDEMPRPALIFRLGLAYPVRAELKGTGLGAERLGIFSTGTARERITAWAPERRLAFELLTQAPAMRELSPYRTVHAPHLKGYLQTLSMRFDLQDLGGGKTRLIATTSQALRLDPVLYWAPMARWAIRQNLVRVLDHVRAEAEKDRLRPRGSPAT